MSAPKPGLATPRAGTHEGQWTCVSFAYPPIYAPVPFFFFASGRHVLLGTASGGVYTGIIMIRVRFPDPESERKALGVLAGRFALKTFADGCTLVPEAALARLASEGLSFTVEGRAAYEQSTPTVRDSPPSSVQ